MLRDQEAINAVYPPGGFPVGHALSQIGLAKRAALWDACGGRCTYCDVALHPFKTFTVDHVIPRSRGGTNALGNLVGVCLTCNHAKSDKGTHAMPERIRARLNAALARVAAGEITPEIRRVSVMRIFVRDHDLDPDELAARVRADPIPDGDPIPAVEIAGGLYWAFADGYLVRVWQITRPNTSVRVAVIPLSDETTTPG